MGLKGFSLSATGAAETRSIPEWSTQHFETTGRPLRIAIDQANWWYRNITAQKEAEIKSQSPGSHPREKRIMERIFYLLRMNIQLLFVFDGSEKPSKHRPATHTYSESNVRLLKELLDQLGVPRHDAPGEAGAECVRLQELGIVDVVWTDDTDTLMFGGSPTLVQFQKPEGDQFKNSNTVLVYSADHIKEHTGLTREWFLMYAILVGCDYVDGLDGFDAARFSSISQHRCFQAAANLLAVAAETPLVLSKWRVVLTNIVRGTFPEEEFAAPPKTFPDLDILKSCTYPTVSPDSVLQNLPCLRDGWFRPYGPGMLSRYRFLLNNFNTRIHESWIARDLVPIELNHRLRETSLGEQLQNRRYGIRAKLKRKDKPDTMITVDPLKVIPELLAAFPTEMYRVVNGSPVKINPPVFRPEEINLLDCVLRRGLPDWDLQKAAVFKPRDSVKKTPKTPPPPQGENSKKPKPVGRLAKRDFTPERPRVVTTPALPSLNTQLLSLPTHKLDMNESPTCIRIHENLTLPGELDWHNPPIESPMSRRTSINPPTEPPFSRRPSINPLIETPVSRRASVLAEKLSGTNRKPSIPNGETIPIFKQPSWDSTAVVELADFD
ncbi:PIN domain-like protein [Xylariaceae sp. FL1651]|nr:PIN domain-like protein [Xylariaceae sp. FL1651]